MGKKSRRPNRNKPKGIPAAALPAVAGPRQVMTSATYIEIINQLIATNGENFNQLIASEEWAGLLDPESEMCARVKAYDGSNPKLAGIMNLFLGDAHKELGREGDIERATLYYQKAIKLSKKAVNNEIVAKGVLGLSQCYGMAGRVDEAMDLYKSLCEEVRKESLDPDAILSFTQILVDNHETSCALTILEEHLEAIESSWENQNQCLAYEMIAMSYSGKNDFAKSNMYFERQLSIAKEMKNVESEASALNGLGHNYGLVGDYGKAMEYLEQAPERGDDRKGLTYIAMGDVLVAQEGREKEAILMYQKCVGLFEQGNEELMPVFFKLGQAYTQIDAWDDAIASLEKGLSIAESREDERCVNQMKALAKQSLGNTYLEKYQSLPERNDELIRKALFWSEAAFNLLNSKGIENLALYLDLAQDHYFLGDLEKAHNMLKRYLDGTLRLGASHCQACRQICAKGAYMEKCSVCKVARYCSQAHSVQAWKKGRLCHKVMCPFLHRWRKITEGKGATAELCDKLFHIFFERVLASKPK